MMTTSKKRLGRPALEPGARSVSVHVKMSPRAYASVYARAQLARVSVPELLRRGVDPPRRT
jgi:hypothetical protein